MRNALALMALTICLAIATCAAQTIASAGPPEVTPTSGESWLKHLHRSFGNTSMGKTGRLGPPADEEGAAGSDSPSGLLPTASQGLTLRGADLYRLNCQGCHGEKGQGAPPEINSVINPVRATSVPLVMERMKKTGMEISASAANQLAKQSQDALLQRLHNGGESMPAFPHLSDAEILTLVAYLKQLAGVPGAAQLTIIESPLRVGELIVKSTCHTCHDAAGANPTPRQLENGAIPPLETLTARTDQVQLIRKVTAGAPVLMGTPPTLHRGRMPVFYYLTKEEAGCVYVYLATVPPSERRAAAPALNAAEQAGGNGQVTSGLLPAPRTSPILPGPAKSARIATSSGGIPDSAVTIALVAIGAGVLGLVLAGLCFAAYELHRLSGAGEQPRKVVALPTRPGEDVEEFALSSGGRKINGRIY